ncbi:tape measure protein [Aliarcobacter butzleri]|uniref:tape measure protein n=1 Tax=Aliarcobacter butzleri TaxID=28197 RepID=UPI0021B22D0B|nr:tape measure protein [Aliarcobacter butzleri]UXC28567.1 tape measure protein [Aliarcobacter butzleri]UXC29234.1 tape measure protein [Aliarcobacter butzleri]
MSQSIGTVLIDVQANTQKLVEGFNNAEQKVNSSISTMKTSVIALTSAYLSFEAVVGGGKMFLQQADALTNTNSRLKLVTASSQELLNMQKQLFAVANDTRTGYLKTIDLYTNITNGAKEYNIEQSKILTVTESINKSVIVGGADAKATEAAMTQLGQAFTSNFKSVGQELGSLRDQAPRLYRAMVEGMGVTSDKFKKMAEDGKLSTEIIIEAILKGTKSIDEDFSKMAKTNAQGVELILNQYLKIVEGIDNKFEISSATVAGLNQITDVLSNINSYLDGLSSEEIENITAQIKNMGIALVGSYATIKTAQGVYSVYNSILESNNKINQLNIKIEKEKSKALYLSERATIARVLADQAYNTKVAVGIELNKTQIKELQKQAVLLESQARKQNDYVTSLESTAKGFNIATVGANLLKGALTTIPLVAISMGISAIATSLLTASKNSEILEKTIKSTSEELSKLTKNQLEYRKSLIETELIQARLDLSNAKAKAANGSLADKSYADEMSVKFEELAKSSRNVKEALSDLSKQKIDLDSKTNTSNQKPIVRDDSAIIKLMGSELSKFNLELDENIKKLQDSGASEVEVDKYRADAIKKFNETRQKANEKLSKDTSKTADEINKAYLDISKIGMSEYEKALLSITEQTKSWLEAGVKTNDALAAQSKLIDELNNKKVIDTAKEDLSYYERLVQLKSDSYEKEIELANIAYTQKALDIQSLNRPIEDKEKLLDLETQLYNKTLERVGIDNQINGLDEASNSYQDMLEAQIDLLDATNDWNSNLTGTAAALADVASATGKLSKLNLTNLKNEDKLRTEYEKNKLKFYDNEEELKKIDLKYTKDKATLDEKNISATLLGYSNIAGALSSMYDEGSREAAAFQIAQSSLALVEGTRAILTAGTGDPFTAIPRMVAMAAIVSPLLSNIGIAFGMNKTSTYSDAFSSIEANTGTGTVLGDSSAQSESITNSLTILKDYAEPQFLVLNEMNSYVKSIESKISGLSSILIKNAGYALGQGFEGFETGYKNKYSVNNDIATAIATGGAGLLLSKLNIPILSDITGLFGNIVNSVLGGLFGKTSVSQSLKDSGIYFADTLLTAAIKQFEGDAYQTIQTTISKKSWFGSSSNTTITSYFKDLDKETNRQFTLVIDSLYDTVLTAGIALDSLEEQTASNLANFVVSLGKISLKDKTGSEIQEILTNVFGALGDNLAITAFPALEDFQQIGEGTFETLTRVAMGMEEADYYISRLGKKFNDVIYTAIGNKQGNVGFEALLQSIEAVEVATYPVNNNLYKIVENLDATAEELYSVYTSLDKLRDRLIFLGQEAQGLSNNMIFGAGSITELENGFEAFFENFLSENEQLTYKTQQLIKEFDNLNIALPISKDSFKSLLSSIDLTTASGQELYGRLIILSDEFGNVANSTQDTIDTLKKSLEDLTTNQFDSFISSLDKVGASITTIKNTALSFLQGLSTSNNSSLEEQIISYNKMRAEFATYFDSEGVIKSGVDENSVNNLYSRISSIATNISGKDDYLKDSLISQFENDIFKFDLADEIIKVNIVDGLGTLYNLTAQQLTQLQTVASDGKITNDELNSITGLTQTQKDGILSFANNSNYFSTEGTLQNLATFAKLQLDAYNKSIAEETAGISTQTLTYGDYIGKQEQIDISKLLGISYETAQPLIKSVQSLTISNNPYSDIASMIGFDGENITNTTTLSQLKALDKYSNIDIQKYLDEIYTTGQNNKKSRLEKEYLTKKEDFYKRYNTAKDTLNMQLEEANLLTSALATFTKIHGDWWQTSNEVYALNILKKFGLSFNTNEARGENINQSGFDFFKAREKKEWDEANYYANLVNNLTKEKALNSYAVGSARIEYDQLAQLHKDEIVAPKTFSDGIRNGDLVMGDNNKVVEAINSLKDITVAQAREIQKMKEALDELNTRDLIKTAKGVA